MKEIMIYSQSLIFLPIILSIMIYVFNKRLVNFLVFPVQFLVSVIVLRFWFILQDEKVIRFTLGGWHKTIGIELTINGLTWLFMLMAVIIWWCVLIYAWQQKGKDFKFLFFLMFLEGCFLGFVQVNDFFTFFVLLEVITIVSSILIIYKKDGISVKAGLYYLLFNSMGMLIYLFGIMLLYFETGTLNMTVIGDQISMVNYAAAEYSVIHISFACIFVAMCVKAALFPVYEWLHRAHTAAPTYVSALLSGLLVKTGVFGLMKLLVMFETFNISDLTYFLGFTTAISGIVFAVSQKDIKAILAFSTISHIGLIIMSVAYHPSQGMIGAYMDLFNHFIVKSLLFFAVGILINEYGERRVTEIKGVARAHPILSILMIGAILSITGSPLFAGFISKSIMKFGNETLWQSFMFRAVGLGKIVIFVHFSRIFIGKPNYRLKIPRGQMFAICAMFVILISSYVMEMDFIYDMYRLNAGFVSSTANQALEYAKKSLYDMTYYLDYLAMVITGVVIYWFMVNLDSKPFHYIRHFRVKFQDAIFSMAIFLSIVIFAL